MNNFFTQLKDTARAIKLSRDEKQAMRVSLYTHFEKNSMGTFAAPVQRHRPTPSMYFFFSTRYVVPVALLLMVGISGGTAFAAQTALPGEPLYAIKIHVNEAVQAALATTPGAKALVHAQLATTRLEEAETLASTGRLDATTTAELAGNFAAHIKAAHRNARDVEANDPGEAAQLNAQVNGALAAHGAILAQIGGDSADVETMQNSHSLALQVEQEAGWRGNAFDAGTHTKTVEAAAPQTSIASGGTSTAAIRTAKAKHTESQYISAPESQQDARIAASLGAQASSSLAAVMQDVATLNPLLDAATAAQIRAQLESAQALYASADASLAAGDVSAAKDAFGSVIRLSIQLDAYLKAGEKFNRHLLNGLLDNADRTEGGGDAESH